MKRPRIHVANGVHRPGQRGELLDVVTIFEFEDGWTGRVRYELLRPNSQAEWRIDRSIVPAQSSLDDGPW